MPQETLENRLTNAEYVSGPLLNAHSRVVPGTELESHEIKALRKLKPELRNLGAWTNNFSMYRVEHDNALGENDVFLYFTGREHNLGFRYIQNFTSQLLESSHNYVPKEGIQEVVDAAGRGEVLRIRISDLQLIHNPGDDFGYFETKNMNDVQRRFTEAIYGREEKPGDRVYVLTSDYVKKQLKGKEDSAIARASRLGGAGSGSRFSADDRGVGFADCGLFGGLKEAPKAPAKIEGVAAAPINPVAQYTQEGILNYLNTNPVSDEKLAAALLKHATLFYQNRTPKA